MYLGIAEITGREPKEPVWYLAVGRCTGCCFCSVRSQWRGWGNGFPVSLPLFYDTGRWLSHEHAHQESRGRVSEVTWTQAYRDLRLTSFPSQPAFLSEGLTLDPAAQGGPSFLTPYTSQGTSGGQQGAYVCWASVLPLPGGGSFLTAHSFLLWLNWLVASELNSDPNPDPVCWASVLPLPGGGSFLTAHSFLSWLNWFVASELNSDPNPDPSVNCVSCPPGSSVHGILQAEILQWVAISSSRASSWPVRVPLSPGFLF